MTFQPPGERIDGTTAECAHLHLLLACFRASPPPMRLPGVTGRPLPEVLATGIIDPEVFRTGYAVMADRYEQLGIRAKSRRDSGPREFATRTSCPDAQSFRTIVPPMSPGTNDSDLHRHSTSPRGSHCSHPHRLLTS